MPVKVTKIYAHQPIRLLNLVELWQYRDLGLFFILRDFKVRYRQTIIGVGWAILQPLLQLIIFTLLFGRLLHVGSEQLPYPVFVLAALIPWNFFANGLNACNYAVINHAGLIRKVYFPRLLIPLSALGTTLIDLGLTLLLFGGLLSYYHIPITVGILWSLPLLGVLFLLTLGLGAWLAALGVRYRDVRHVIPFFIQLGLFLTPVVYGLDALQGNLRLLLYLNPVAGVITALRAALLHLPLEPAAISCSLLWMVLILVGGVYFFQKQAQQFADYI